MRVIIFGATGMVGRGALLECLDDPRVTAILVVGRSPCGAHHAKLEEVLHDNFLNFSALQSKFAAFDTCFYCIGVSAVGISDAKYIHLTYELTMVAARALLAANALMTFCFISAQGADTTGESRLMWARTKGRTEVDVSSLPFNGAFVFRPGFIRPMRGVRSRTRAYQLIYALTGPAIPLLQWAFPRHVTSTVNIGKALIDLAHWQLGHMNVNRRTLENADINAVAART